MKHVVKLEVYYSGAWHDVVADDELLTDVMLTTNRTAASITDNLTPGSMQGSLLSTSGRWHPYNPMSPLYGLLDINPPARVTIDASLRWSGTLSQVQPMRPHGKTRRVRITGGGVVRSINIGTSPLISALTSAIIATSPMLYLPLIDGPLATQAGTPLASGSVADMNGAKFGQVDGPAGDPRKLPQLVGDQIGGTAAWSVYLVPPTGSSWAIDTMVRGERLTGAFTSFDPLAWVTAPDTASEVYWQLGISWNGASTDPDVVRLFAYTVTGTFVSLTVDVSAVTVFDGGWHHIRVSGSTSGSTTATVSVDDAAVSGSAALPAGGIGRLDVINAAPSVLKSGSVGHIAIHNTSTPASISAAALGYLGETSEARFARVCAEQGITCYPTSTSDVPMGQQPVATVTDTLTDIVRTDGGLAWEGVDGFLNFDSMSALYRRSAIVVNVDTDIVPPLDQVVADRSIRNDVTAQRPQGSSARYEVATGRLGTSGGMGRIASTVNVNPELDSSLIDHASWWAHAWTVDGVQYSKITIDCDAAQHVTPTLAYDSIDIGSVIQLASVPAIDDPNTPRLLVVGIAETVQTHRRLITLTVRSMTPYDVGLLNTAGYLDCGGSTTSGALSSTVTSVPLAITDQCVWTHSDGDYDVVIDGERMTVTTVGAASGAYPAQTQTLTVTRSVNGVVKAHSAGAEVHVADPFTLAR